jgi:two-component sensor histidine kinase
MFASLDRRSVPAEADTAWLLLTELNHRVGNELQTALSALRSARRSLLSSVSDQCIEEAEVRLQCLGTIHQLLDRRCGERRVAQRLAALCRATALAKAAPLGINLTLSLDDVNTDEETAWTVCVVAFELMTNALKHAFAGTRPGLVAVVLRQDGEDVLLSVTDNGAGMGMADGSAEIVWQARGDGTGIVIQLAERLGGSVTRVNGPVGTIATFSAPAAQCMR